MRTRELRARRCKYTFDISRELNNEFEAACAIRNTKRNLVMLKMIQGFVEGDKDIQKALKKRYAIQKDGE